MVKRLIVNADDFGWSTGVNRGIIDARRQGILTSATLLVNFPAHADAIERLADCPELGVGLHLNITHGRPLSAPDEIPSLLASGGAFPGPETTLRRLLLGRIRRQELDRELRAQLGRFREVAGMPTHIDSHKHLHVFGCFLDAVVDLALELEAPRIRCPLDRRAKGPHAFSVQSIKCRLLRWAGRRAVGAYRRAGLVFPDTFVGVDRDAVMSREGCERFLAGLGAGVTELMCHPGYASDDQHDVVPNVAVTALRESEQTVVADASLRARATELGVELVHYGEI